ncbi:MAG: VanZ family protein [Bacilli bacterium]|nr:VanZ family protein [Bacilli bacterium]
MKIVEKKQVIKYIYLMLYIICVGIVWLFSLQSGEISSEESGVITSIFIKVINFLSFNKFEFDFEIVHLLIRKIVGHFGSFFVVGILGFLTYNAFTKDLFKTIIITSFSGVIVAIIAEVLQLFAINRGYQITDMMIDCCGYFLGTAICVLITFIKKHKTSNNA